MQSDNQVQVEIDEGILCVNLNRLEKKNAINQGMYQELCHAFSKAQTDDNIKALLFRSNQGCYSAGNELSEFVVNEEQSIVNFDSPVFQFISALRTFSKPLIAAVSGPAVGIGTTMLLHFDMVFADDSALFCMPFTQLGICAEAGSSMLLPMQVGYHKAAEWLLSGRNISAKEALEANLINEIVNDVNEQALKISKMIASLPQSGVLATRSLLKKYNQTQPIDNLENVIIEEWNCIRKIIGTEETQTRIRKMLDLK